VVQTERLADDERTWSDVHAFLELEPRPVPSPAGRVNDSRRERPVAEATLDALAAHFERSNRAVAARYGIDLALWRPPG
jgi:hypothetical protein